MKISFSDVDMACLDSFGIQATLLPRTGDPEISISGIIQTPSMAEEFTAGGADGVSVINFFIRIAEMTYKPVRGDTVTINSVVYTVGDVGADSEGGAVLKLRRNA